MRIALLPFPVLEKPRTAGPQDFWHLAPARVPLPTPAPRPPAECRIFVSLFHCFTCFTCFTWNMKQWNSIFRFSSETVKQWNSYRKKERNSETVSLFHQNRFYFWTTEKMVLEHLVWANLLFFQPIFQKNREFRKQNKFYSRTNSISIYWYRLDLFV